MPLDRDFYTTLDSTPSRAVLLSERSLAIFLSALDDIQDRPAWDDMTDTDWDDTEGWLGDATTQIIDVQTGGSGVDIEQKSAWMTSDFTISGSQSNYPIEWDSGDMDATNPERIYVANTGRFILTANFDYNSAGGNRLDPVLRVNGTPYGGLIQSAAANRSNAFCATLDLVAGDYVEFVANTNGTVAIATDAWASRVDLTGFY